MSKTLSEIFPQLNRIKDADLRAKTEKCWLTAIERGGWRVGDLETIPFTMMSDLKEISLAAHTRNVTDCSIAVAEVMNKSGIDAYQINFDHLIAGGLLHDVGKVLEYEKAAGDWAVTHAGNMMRHPISGAAVAYEIQLPEEVTHIIAVHSHEGDKHRNTTEAWIVHHCDFINFDPIKRK